MSRLIKLKRGFKNLPREYYFPFALLFIIVVLSFLKLSGSSVGVYDQYLNPAIKDDALIHGEPRLVRSDEWLVNTPMVLSQLRSGEKVVNPLIGQGQDMSLLLDVPYKGWPTLFRPHDWSYFIFSNEVAFAFNWWGVSYLLIISVYFFVLKFLPKRIVYAILISLGFYLNPFLHWWYHGITFLPIAYTLFGLLFGFRIVDHIKQKRNDFISASLLGFLGFAFVILLYPPRMIPCAIVGAAVFIGYLLNIHITKKGLLQLGKHLSLSVAISAILVSIFYVQHQDSIKAMLHTVYPGNRVVESGGASLDSMFGGLHNFQLQSNIKARALPDNQSESSNFINLLPFLLLPSLLIVLQDYRKKRATDWLLISSLSAGLLLTLHLYAPLPHIVGAITLLDKVPHARLLIGLGMVSLLTLIFLIRRLTSPKSPVTFSAPSATLFSAVAASLSLLSLLDVKTKFPEYIHSTLKITVLSFLIGAIVYALLSKRIVFSLTILLVIGFISTYNINPIYHGLGFLQDSELKTVMDKPEFQNKKWAVFESPALNTVPLAYGKSSITGVYVYPQKGLWEEIDKDRSDTDIYNRYAHVSLSDDFTQDLRLKQADSFAIRIDPCSGFLKEHVQMIISGQKLNSQCLGEVNVIKYSNYQIRIYEVK